MMRLIILSFCFLNIHTAFGQQIFMKVNDPFFTRLDQNDSKSGYIELNGLTYETALRSEFEFDITSSRISSKPSLLTIYLPYGNYTVPLFKHMYNSTVGTKLEIIFTTLRDGINYETYQTLKFDNFIIASIEPNGLDDVKVTLQFEKFYIENSMYNANGYLGQKTSFGWDFIEGQTWSGL